MANPKHKEIRKRIHETHAVKDATQLRNEPLLRNAEPEWNSHLLTRKERANRFLPLFARLRIRSRDTMPQKETALRKGGPVGGLQSGEEG